MHADNDSITQKQAKTVMLVDDQTLYREALASLIITCPHLDVISQVGFNEQTLETAGDLKPDIILVDPCYNHEDNIPFIHRLVSGCKESHILLISSPCRSNVYFDFIRAGVSGIVLKTQSAGILLKAIDRVLSNELWFDRTLLTSALQEIEKSNQIAELQENGLACLSKREREIVNLVVNGLNTLSIAKTLHISEKTVRNHIYSVYGKLEVRDRLELALFATRNGISPASSQ
ncbi:response regulator transcription factor [Methylobacter marinus]|jgi:DNA-binding NarL/FixJ family response regulator|uniref:response regulator transcription factor n=1 Tax=Methylobacter marinus TaxID=34058 RepID=UPI000377E1B4|nr:response regulator transcription factor [Methylobacter marinus]